MKNHSLAECFGTRQLLKSDGVANFLPKYDIHLFGYTPGHRHGCHPSGLSASNLLLIACIACLSNELGNLCGLATACLSNQDGGLALIQHLDKVISGLPNR